MNNESDPAELSLDFLWARLSGDEQLEAAECFWKGHSGNRARVEPQVVAALASFRNFREKFVRERPVEWKTAELCKHLARPPLNVFIDDVLREFLIERRKEMICAILDGEGTPHKAGWIAEEAPAPTADVFVRGLVSVRGKHDDRDVLIYYIVNHVGGEHWKALGDAFERPEFQDLMNAVVDSKSGSKDSAEPVDQAAAENAGQAEANEEFTTLDNLLIKTVVASATGTEGSLSPDALEDLVQEVLTLGVERHRSYFHLGYLDAVLGKELRGEFTGSNVSRRGWYLTGYLMGRLRSVQAGQIVQIVKDKGKWWEELLTEGPMSARIMLLPSLVRRFADAGEWRLLRELLERTHLPADAKRAMQLSHMTYEIAADLVRRGASAEAVPLLQILLKHLGQASALPKQFVARVGAAALRKLGQAHLRAGRFGEAKKLLGKALEQPDFPEAANARADLGLAEAGFRSLDFLLPKEDEKANETTVKALEKQMKNFEQALTHGGRATNAHFVLGLMAFHRGRVKDAEDQLSSSLPGMLKKESAYQTAHLVDWTRFLLAILIAEQCEPARLNEVRGHVDSAIASPAFFPLHLWTRLCRNLSLYDDQSLAEAVIQHVLKKRGDPGYGLLKESGLLTKNAALRSSYRRWLETQAHAPARKAAELESLLNAAFKDGEPEEVTEILDALEGVAKSDADCVPSFLSLLKTRRSDILAIWDERDVDNMEAALLERTGRFPECFEVLQRMFYRCRADGDWAAIEELLEQIEHLKVPELDVNQLKAQAEHLRPSSCPERPATLSLNGIGVLYVGGNEIQARYEQSIRDGLTNKHPGLSVTFYYPGWSSNWNVHLERILCLIPDHNVVVINNLVRTQLGRKLRAACGNGIPWRACTGHGRKSLLHSIEVAACWIALRGKE